MKSIRHLTLVEKLPLINDAKLAELSRDMDSLREILQVFWSDFSQEPDFDEFPLAVQAELYRLAGFFITFLGRSRGEKDFQPKAKNLLTQSIEIFEAENLADKAAESKIILAFAYWNSGEISECNAILDIVEEEFKDNPYHYVFLRSKLNRLICFMWSGTRKDLLKAERLVKNLGPKVTLCKERFISVMYHSEAAILYYKLKKIKTSEFHFMEAVRVAKKTKNIRFCASNYNNLAFLQIEKKDFTAAHRFADAALKIFAKLGDAGWTAHVQDTKANIYFAQGNYEKTLEYIEKSLKVFTSSEDTNGFCDALFLKIKALLRMKRESEALFCFAELQRIAISRVGEIAAKKYCDLMATEIYGFQEIGFKEEVEEFKRNLVRSAFVSSGNKITLAARKLKIKHQHLVEILDKQFPGLRADLGIKKRTRKPQNRKVVLKSEDIVSESISLLVLPDKNFSFPFDLESKQFEVFYFDKFFMQNFNIDSGAIVAVVPVSRLEQNLLVLVTLGNSFIVGKIQYDSMSGIFFILDKNGEPFPVSMENVIGEPKGYCFVQESKSSFISFRPLEFRS